MPNFCPICSTAEVEITHYPGSIDADNIKCKFCGNYGITGTARAIDVTRYGPRWKFSGAIRIRYEKGEKLELDTENIPKLLEATVFSDDPFILIDHLLEYILMKTKVIGKSIKIVEFDYPAILAENSDQLFYILKKAHDLKYLEKDGDWDRLSLEGWRRISEIRKTKKESDNAFVAMWFNPELENAWQHGIKPALIQTGFKPIRIDLEEHNEKICDKIIAEIRNAGLLIADFTGQRGGVYFEAGFALGLGINVIWTCRSTDIDKLHFDTRQYNHIVWDTPDQLKQKLINRILATIPGKKLTAAN